MQKNHLDTFIISFVEHAFFIKVFLNIAGSKEKIIFYTMMWPGSEPTKAESQKSENTQRTLVFIENHKYFKS